MNLWNIQFSSTKEVIKILITAFVVLGIFLTFFFVVFAAQNINYSISEKHGSIEACYDGTKLTGDPVLDFKVDITNNGPGRMHIARAAFHSDKAGCSATTEGAEPFNVSGKDDYFEGESGTAHLTYDSSRWTCGRVQFDASFVDDQTGKHTLFLGQVIDYGVDCGTPPPPPPPPSLTCDLNASKISITRGEKTTLNWTSTGGVRAWIEPILRTAPLSGSLEVSPNVTTKYFLHVVDGDNREVICDKTITVTDPPPNVCTVFYKVQDDKGNPLSGGVHRVFRRGDTNTFENLPGPNFTKANLPEGDWDMQVVSHPQGYTFQGFNPNKAPLNCPADGRTVGWILTYKKDPTTNPKTDISIEKSVTPEKDILKAGPTFTYTLAYKNLGSIDAQNTTIADVASPVGKLDNYKITKQPEHGSCVAKSNGITCSIGTLPVGEVGTIKYTAIGVAVGVIDNTAVIDTSTPETDLTNNKDSEQVEITDPKNPPVSCDSFKANPSTLVNKEDQTTLSWTTTNAVSASIDQGVGSVPVNGSKSVNPLQSRTYTLTATGADGKTATCSASVVVDIIVPPPQCTLTANPKEVISGGTTILTWTTTNAVSASIDQGVGNATPVSGGSKSSNPITADTTFTMTAIGNDGSTITCSDGVKLKTIEQGANVFITKSVTPASALKGSIFTYTLNYGNNGTLDTDNVTILDVASPSNLVTGYTITKQPNHGSCSTNSNGISCSLGKLSSGDTGSITYTVQGIEVGVVKNTAEIKTTTTETTLADNKDNAEISIFINSTPPCTVNCGGGQNPPRVVMFMNPTEEPFASKSFVYLSQVPYTGLPLNAKGILFIVILTILSAVAAYFVLRKQNEEMSLVAQSGATDLYNRSFEKDRAVSVAEIIEERVVKEAPIEESHVPKENGFQGNNLPTEGIFNNEEKIDASVDVNLESYAKDKGVLISSSALNFLSFSSSIEKREQKEILDSVISIAGTMYPREDGFIILDKKRVENIILSPNYNVVSIFANWLSKGESEKVFGFIRLLRTHKISVKAFLKKITYFIDSLYRCRIGENVNSDYQMIDLENECTNWSNKEIQKIVSILVDGVDESYDSEDASVKLALVKILEISEKSKIEGKSYYSS